MVKKKKQVVKKTVSNKERLEKSISENQIKTLAEKIFKTEVAEDVTDILKETNGMLHLTFVTVWRGHDRLRAWAPEQTD